MIRGPVKKPDPHVSGNAGQAIQQRGKALFRLQVLTICGSVLGDQHNFFIAFRYKGFCFGDNVWHLPASKPSPEFRNYTVGAMPVASVADSKVGDWIG